MTTRLTTRAPRTARLALALTAVLSVSGCSPLSVALVGVRLLATQPAPPVAVAGGPIAVDELLARARGDAPAAGAERQVTLRYAADALTLSVDEWQRLEARLRGLDGSLVVDLRVGPAGAARLPNAGFRAVLRARALGRKLAPAVTVRSIRYAPVLPHDTLQVTLHRVRSEPRA